jgi:hypothetical protein
VANHFSKETIMYMAITTKISLISLGCH